MGIVDEDIQRVREATDIVGLINGYTQLKRVGRRSQGLCPFHSEKSPSFSVNGEQGLYKCFGCGVGGDAITFVREIETTDFVGAVEFLANKAGMQVRYTDTRENEGRQRRRKLVKAIGEAVTFYNERLLTAPDAGEARGYLRSRGYDGDVVRKYQLGWAPDEWDQLAKSVRLSDEDWVDSGLGRLNKRGGKYDFFRGRILFPIFDENNDGIGFGGRILPGSDDPAKYKNTSDESIVYNKSSVLYGLNWAKASAARTDLIVVCEGYTDVIGFGEVGEDRAVATCGTALTEDHVKKLKKYASKIVLAFDADAAGQKAAERFFEWEQRYEVDVYVADLPRGVDPGDLAGSDPDRLRLAIEEAMPFLGFRVNRVLDAADLRTPEGRARAAEAAVAIVQSHPSDLVRDQYVMTIAGRCQVNPQRLRDRLNGGARAIQGRRVQTRATNRATSEHQALRLFVHKPESVREHLHAILFDAPLYLEGYRLLADGKAVRDVLADAEPDVADLLTRVATEDADDDPAGVVTRLVQLAAERIVTSIEFEATTTGDIESYLPSISWLRTQIMELREPRDDIEDLDELIHWLAEHGQEWAA
jgi:DNA primase